MTTTAITPVSTVELIEEFAGGQQSSVDMMIGVGLVKDSEAVFFQYTGEDANSAALMLPSGKPLTRLANVKLAGIDIATDVGEFNSTKLNLYLESSQGRVIMLTSGLNTIWSQCIVTGLMGLYGSYDLSSAFTLDSWKGTSKMKPCFAAIRVEGNKVSDQMFYDQLADARADRDQAKVKAIMTDSVEMLKVAVSGVPADIVVEETTEEKVDF